MSLTELPLAVLRYQYQMARVPFQVIEDQFVARLDPQAPARLFYERSLGALDATAGKMLGDPELEKRGAALAHRGDALGRAAQLEATATQKHERADELKAKRDKATQDLNQGRATKQRPVKQARSAAAERKRDTTEAAEKRSAGAKQADEVAAQRIDAAESATPEDQTQIRAAEQDALNVAALDLADAQAKRSDAARKREQADQVEAVADAEKQEPQV